MPCNEVLDIKPFGTYCLKVVLAVLVNLCADNLPCIDCILDLLERVLIITASVCSTSFNDYTRVFLTEL